MLSPTNAASSVKVGVESRPRPVGSAQPSSARNWYPTALSTTQTLMSTPRPTMKRVAGIDQSCSRRASLTSLPM